ncbi:MAG TPA: 1-phosphofructokinase family hexose kinase [Microbacteriaceae bacterium]|nr:1-phosphofructokinase family hexose kinase [Microbacteriaceae bacterium]
MIVTVTANPSIDITVEVPSFIVGEVNRATATSKDPAGKGINVARALTRNGIVTSAVFPADRSGGAWIIDSLGKLGVPTQSIHIAGEVRQNITVVDGSGETTKINQAGPTLSPAEVEALTERVREALATGPAWLVAAGSLPGGVDSDFYVQLGTLAREANVRFAVDASGEALGAVAHAGVADLLKPNLEELEDLAERSLDTVGAVVEFCRSLPGGPGACILVSLGANGALLVNRERVLWAGHPPVVPDSTVGAGDCTLAGFLADDARARHDGAAEVDPLAARLVSAVAWGTAAVQLPATTVPSPDLIRPGEVVLRADVPLTTSIKELHA